jgi:hypothetical protein
MSRNEVEEKKTRTRKKRKDKLGYRRERKKTQVRKKERKQPT